MFAMKVVLKNPVTEEFKEIKIGWSWTIFFFSGIFGIPLFLRRLYGWGVIFIAFNILLLLLPQTYYLFGGFHGLFWVIFVLLQVAMSIKGNEMTARNYFAHGWVFAEPDSLEAQVAKSRWKLRDPGPLWAQNDNPNRPGQ
jgi:hypothetical protein